MIRRSATPVLAVCCLVYAWCFVLDTGAHRKLVAWRVRRLVHQARNSLNRTSSADKLMTMARSSWEYESVIAIAGVRNIGAAAKPHIRDLAMKNRVNSITYSEWLESMALPCPSDNRV